MSRLAVSHKGHCKYENGRWRFCTFRCRKYHSHKIHIHLYTAALIFRANCQYELDNWKRIHLPFTAQAKGVLSGKKSLFVLTGIPHLFLQETYHQLPPSRNPQIWRISFDNASSASPEVHDIVPTVWQHHYNLNRYCAWLHEYWWWLQHTAS